MSDKEKLLAVLKEIGANPSEQNYPAYSRSAGHWGDTRETAGKWIEALDNFPAYNQIVVGSIFFEFDAEGKFKETGFDDPDY